MYKKHFDKQAHLCPDWQNGEKSPESWRINLDAKSGPFESGDFAEKDKISPEGWRYPECGNYSN